jgi:NAD(P)-dependent dehydrogenase (short-subunit alcohol dehydrogenase family)
MSHSALERGRVAVVTGAASGIGLAACRRFAELGMKICMVDIDQHALSAARAEVVKSIRGAAGDVLAISADVASMTDVQSLKDSVYDSFGETGLLMNNAVTRTEGGCWDNYDQWQRAVDVNLWGVINAVQCFVPAMLAQGTPCTIVNTGSKQGITNPPGKPAYNVCKAALKAYTECLQHELRNRDDGRISAHLLIPGWTTTGNRTHVQGAWLPDQVIDVLMTGLGHGDFYILCPDDEVSPEMDRKRILWAAHDIVDNRPPLSRWHPDFAEAFEKFSSA